MSKHITILHNNDMHGDFLPHVEDGREVGGLARLAGFVKQARMEEDHVLYALAGDMFRGSIIDSEYLGLSTIDLMNLLAPDVTTVGNHEVDYGLAHLLFLEKCATFPIINANLFVTFNNTRLFVPYHTVRIGGMKVLFIGILTEEVIASTKQEKVIGTFVDVREAAREVGVICDNYRNRDADLTVLLTHIGIEKDRELAAQLRPAWGVDLIIGGHSHTFMDQMEVVNGVPIVQVGKGTSQIGRFDIEVDNVEHEVLDVQWRCEPIDETTAPTDTVMEDLLDHYRSETDAKYKRVITYFARELTHPERNQETEMGNLYADIMQVDSSFDIMFMGSGAIRKQAMGQVVEVQDMMENTPFDDAIWMVKVTGAQLRRIVTHICRDDAWLGHTEFYQVSRGFHFTWRKSTHTLEELTWQGEAIRDDQMLTIALQEYHFANFDEFLGVPFDEVEPNMRPCVVASSFLNIVEEYFSTHQNLDAHVEGRMQMLD